jgi:hypothetical protein
MIVNLASGGELDPNAQGNSAKAQIKYGATRVVFQIAGKVFPREFTELHARKFISKGPRDDRSTLTDWVGGASRLLRPLVEELRQYVMEASKLHADDTPVPVLAPGNGQTKTGRLWAYVRDDRPAGDQSPSAVWFAYSPDPVVFPLSLVTWSSDLPSRTAKKKLTIAKINSISIQGLFPKRWKRP